MVKHFLQGCHSFLLLKFKSFPWVFQGFSLGYQRYIPMRRCQLSYELQFASNVSKTQTGKSPTATYFLAQKCSLLFYLGTNFLWMKLIAISSSWIFPIFFSIFHVFPDIFRQRTPFNEFPAFSCFPRCMATLFLTTMYI